MSDEQPVTTPDLVNLTAEATDQASVVEGLITLLENAGRAVDSAAIREGLMAREAVGSTAIPGGIAIPHTRTSGIEIPSVVVLRLGGPVAWAGGAAPVDLILGLFTPAEDREGYLALLASLTRGVVGRLPTDLRSASTAPAAAAMVQQAIRR